MPEPTDLRTLRRGLLAELAYARRSAWTFVEVTTTAMMDMLAEPDLDREALRGCMADLKAVVAIAERRVEGYERLLACVDADPRRPASLGDLLEAAGQTAGLVVEIIWPPECTAAEFEAEAGWIRGLKSHFGQVFHSVPGAAHSLGATRAVVRVDREAGTTRISTTLAGADAGDVRGAPICLELPG
jgi:hypothetical protein